MLIKSKQLPTGNILYSNGTITSKKGQILKCYIDTNDGYVRASSISKCYGTTLLHRAIALEFIPIPEKYKNIPIDKLQVNHIDGNKLNNDISNLEWCTCKENVQHAIITGLDHRQNIRDERIHGIIADRNNYMPMSEIVEKYKISASSLYRLLKENNCYNPRGISNNPLVNECIALRNDEHLSITDIAEILGIGQTTVYVYLQEDKNYQSLHRKTQDNDKNKILDLYLNEKKSAYAISKELGISKPTVLNFLRQFDWYNGEERKLNADDKYDFDTLTNLREEGKTWKQIAEIYEANPTSIKCWYNKRKNKLK